MTTENQRKIRAIIPEDVPKTVRINHERGKSAGIRVECLGPDDCRIIVTGSDVPASLYRDIIGRLKEVGTEKIELTTRGWWLGDDDEKPEKAVIADHVACHLPSPLTGTEEAARGKAFVSMRDAYSTAGIVESGVREVILWHTRESDGLSEAEIETARRAGCEAASPDAAAWVICAKAEGIDVSATVRIAD